MQTGPIRKALLFTIALLAVMFAGCSQNRVAFKGQELREGRDGINVRVAEEGGVLAVSSTKFHYSLILPYADEWDFSWQQGYILSGSAGSVNVQLSAQRTGDSDMDYLRQLRQRLLEEGAVPGLESAEITLHRGAPVLVSVVNGSSAMKDKPEYEGIKHFNIFVVRKWKDIMYRLHLSTPVVEGDEGAERRRAFLDYATAGFSVSYMRQFSSGQEDPVSDVTWRRGAARKKPQ